MIKRFDLENDIISGMVNNLTMTKKASAKANLGKAIDLLSSASEMLDEQGFAKQSDQIVSILSRIAEDYHTKGLTPEKMVSNLKHHGTEFNMSDDVDILNADLDLDDDEDFEDE